MENPWPKLSSAPFVLESDRAAVEKFNAKAPYHFKLQTKAVPGPFLGNPDAPVVLLNLNPGFAESDEVQEGQPIDLNHACFRNLRHEPMDYPFFLLDPKMDAAGQGWWSRKFKSLIYRYNAHFVANQVLCVEYFPYPSVKAHGFCKRDSVESQKYGFYLVRKAIERKAVILTMRVERAWCYSVPELESYEHKYRVRNHQNPSISENNCPDAYRQIINKLDALFKS